MAEAMGGSGWGQRGRATADHNLFGIKGTGPAGSDPQTTQEFENGQMVTRIALFRVYHDVAESIDDHGKLLATRGYYRQPLAHPPHPHKFPTSLPDRCPPSPTIAPNVLHPHPHRNRRLHTPP